MTQISFWVGEKEALSFLPALLGSFPPPLLRMRVCGMRWDALSLLHLPLFLESLTPPTLDARSNYVWNAVKAQRGSRKREKERDLK